MSYEDYEVNTVMDGHDLSILCYWMGSNIKHEWEITIYSWNVSNNPFRLFNIIIFSNTCERNMYKIMGLKLDCIYTVKITLYDDIDVVAAKLRWI
jgi:hypothetical protein